MMSCKNCGSAMLGDGITIVLHCEYVEEDQLNVPPDSDPIYCEDEIFDDDGEDNVEEDWHKDEDENWYEE